MSPLALLSSLRWCDAVAVVAAVCSVRCRPLVGLLPADCLGRRRLRPDYTYLAIGHYPGMPRAGEDGCPSLNPGAVGSASAMRCRHRRSAAGGAAVRR